MTQQQRGPSRSGNFIATVVLLCLGLMVWKGVAWLSWKVGHPIQGPGEVYRAYFAPFRPDKKAMELAIQEDATKKLAGIQVLSDVSCTKVELMDGEDDRHLEGVATLSNGVQRHVKVTFDKNHENWMWQFD